MTVLIIYKNVVSFIAFQEVFNKLRRSDEFDDKVIDACKAYISK